MTINHISIRIRGKDVTVPAVANGDYTLITTGRFFKTAQLFDEELVEDAHFPHPDDAIHALHMQRLPADIFSFARPFDSEANSFDFIKTQDNLAVVSTRSFDDWWAALPQESRKNVRLAAKRGVAVQPVDFSEDLVRGIKKIYDETPVRQGRIFWHFQKDFERVKMLNATYPERSQFLGAYLGDELIGFIKYIRTDGVAVLIQIIAMEAHREKRTINALLKHTVELCHQQGIEKLTYGKFDYGINQNSSLAEFKRRNGFSELVFPRYFVPLSPLGKLSALLGLHQGWRHIVPPTLRTKLHRTRSNLLRAVKIGSTQGGSANCKR